MHVLNQSKFDRDRIFSRDYAYLQNFNNVFHEVNRLQNQKQKCLESP